MTVEAFLRRRIARPFSQLRESITFKLSLSAWQKGQFMREKRLLVFHK